MKKKGIEGKLTKGDLLQFIIIALVVLLIRVFLFTPLRVEGISMAPTLATGERLWAVKQSKIERFDIISFKSPVDPTKTYIKRVIGLPGDHVSYKADLLYINGEEIPEPYLENYKSQLDPGQLFTEDYSLESHLNISDIPQGYYFVLGDNRPHSFDSNEFGLISKKAISGEAKFKYWPISDFGKID